MKLDHKDRIMKYIYDIKPPKKERCVRCGIYIKGKYGYYLNKGLHCEDCFEIGLFLQQNEANLENLKRSLKLPIVAEL